MQINLVLKSKGLGGHGRSETIVIRRRKDDEKEFD